MSEEAPNEYENGGLTPEQQEMADWYLATRVPAEVEKRDCGTEIAEIEALFADFEQTHSLEALHAIIELDPNDAPNHPVREPARISLRAINAKLNTIKRSDISEANAGRVKEIQALYTKFSRAVGIINNGTVDHTR